MYSSCQFMANVHHVLMTIQSDDWLPYIPIIYGLRDLSPYSLFSLYSLA